MVQMPKSQTIEAIYKHYEDEAAKEPRRTYLGGSLLGEECCRMLWYYFRWVDNPKFQGRILRLFETGQNEEDRIIKNLRSIGVEVLDVNPATGKQWRYNECNGHLSGGLDGVVRNLPEAPKTWHLLECKTSNQKYYNAIEKHGCEKEKPTHWAQVQLYLGMAELKRAIYIVQNKNTDELYTERIKFEPNTYRALLRKASRVINAESPLERLSKDPSFWKCKFCDYSKVCHAEIMPAMNCRTCVRSTPVENGRWKCNDIIIIDETMPTGCPEHFYIPPLLDWAEPLDGSKDGWMIYKNKLNSQEFINAAASAFPAKDLPVYSSEELSRCLPKMVGDPVIDSARKILEGKVISCENCDNGKKITTNKPTGCCDDCMPF